MEEERAVRRDEKKPLGKKKKRRGARGGMEVEGWLLKHRGDGRKKEDDE